MWLGTCVLSLFVTSAFASLSQTFSGVCKILKTGECDCYCEITDGQLVLYNSETHEPLLNMTITKCLSLGQNSGGDYCSTLTGDSGKEVEVCTHTPVPPCGASKELGDQDDHGLGSGILSSSHELGLSPSPTKGKSPERTEGTSKSVERSPSPERGGKSPSERGGESPSSERGGESPSEREGKSPSEREGEYSSSEREGKSPSHEGVEKIPSTEHERSGSPLQEKQDSRSSSSARERSPSQNNSVRLGSQSPPPQPHSQSPSPARAKTPETNADNAPKDLEPADTTEANQALDNVTVEQHTDHVQLSKSHDSSEESESESSDHGPRRSLHYSSTAIHKMKNSFEADGKSMSSHSSSASNSSSSEKEQEPQLPNTNDAEGTVDDGRGAGSAAPIENSLNVGKVGVASENPLRVERGTLTTEEILVDVGEDGVDFKNPLHVRRDTLNVEETSDVSTVATSIPISTKEPVEPTRRRVKSLKDFNGPAKKSSIPSLKVPMTVTFSLAEPTDPDDEIIQIPARHVTFENAIFELPTSVLKTLKFPEVSKINSAKRVSGVFEFSIQEEL